MPSGITQKSSGEDSGPGASQQYSVIRVEVNTRVIRMQREEPELTPKWEERQTRELGRKR